MSDPAKSSEIEDVLASIRRLVSVDPTGTMARDRRAAPKKLMLTSDFRVGPGDDDDGDVSDEQRVPLVLEARDDPQDDEVASAFGASDDPRESEPDAFEFGQDADLGTLQIVTEDSEPADAPPGRGAAQSQDDGRDTAEVPEDTDTGPAGRDISLEARIAQLEAAVSSEGADFEPDGSEDLRQHRPDRVPEAQKHVEAELTDAIAALVFDTGQDHAASAGSDDPSDAPEDVTGNIPENDKTPDAESDTSEDVEPDMLAEFVSHARRDQRRESAEDAQTLGVDQSEPDTPVAANNAPTGPQTALPDDDDDSDLLDEAALRALVSEIVRSELQGALGERITRNVRKLVRREIMRAITVRDMG